MIIKALTATSLVAVGACTQSAPQQPANPLVARTLPYQRASASEVFHLRSKCAELGKEIQAEQVHGPALAEDQSSHYNPNTNRCFVQIGMTNMENAFSYTSSTLFDGQTKEILATYTIQNGRSEAYIFGRARPINSSDQSNFDIVKSYVRELMNDDRKN